MTDNSTSGDSHPPVTLPAGSYDLGVLSAKIDEAHAKPESDRAAALDQALADANDTKHDISGVVPQRPSLGTTHDVDGNPVDADGNVIAPEVASRPAVSPRVTPPPPPPVAPVVDPVTN